ncbi:hypothetical protein ORJ04_21760 [Rheinheimera baltica]|uniref:Uncharacterized protein n=1 Tax=Rheinheimera baltica TaxID=67576 RepID=A0ABT9I5A3_9GAMM|nr:hypothetical protein [Rheinheimera baltica]MDP5138577.1 hypothetical protein [Rheinheimera baltica]MDP5151681.1 hypothetical protein [Rheinheimera baltica]
MRYFYLVAPIVVLVFAVAMFIKDEASTYTESTVVPVQTIATVQFKERQKAAQPDAISLLSQNEQPQTMHELQQQYDDYYALALELLHRARAGNGMSQLELANLLLFCQNATMLDFSDDTAVLLSFELSNDEQQMLIKTLDEVEKCEGFRGADYKHFDDENYTNEQALERTVYWFKKAFENEVTDAAAYLLGLHQADLITLSDTELSRGVRMLKSELLKPTVEIMSILASYFSSYEYSYAVTPALQQDPGFYKKSDRLEFEANTSVINCLKYKFYSTKRKERNYDCAENVARYGMWVQPELIPEIEAEVEKVKAAWKNGDYAAAGFEALLPLLNDTSNP